MRWIRNKILCVFLEFVCFVIQIVNLFLSDIVLYETTENISFNWVSLLHNRLFWIVMAIQVLYFILTSVFRKMDKITDDKVIDAIDRNEIVVLDSIGENVQRGDFESANKALKIFNKLEKKKRKRR